MALKQAFETTQKEVNYMQNPETNTGLSAILARGFSFTNFYRLYNEPGCGHRKRYI